MSEPEPDVELSRRVPYPFCRAHGVVPVRVHDGRLVTLTRKGDFDPTAFGELRRAYGLPVKVTPVDAETFDKTLETIFAEVAERLDDMGAEVSAGEELIGDLLDSDADAPVVRFINGVLSRALSERASDVHFEIHEGRAVVRLRVDGALADIAEPGRSLFTSLVSRLKIMAQLDIAERRLPQDGRFPLRLGGRKIDVRIATVPTTHGERVTLRLLEKRATAPGLSELGMPDNVRADFEALVARPHGMVLVTGPTGSGKSTTLYAALATIDRARRNVMTVEDPVEYDLDGANQIPVNAGVGMTFARALRSILRHDPDVVMIGEIRDTETARIAVQASLTGHLVLATLHTNDAAGAITRLVDMEVEPYLLSSSLTGVMAQRLVRRLCPQCRNRTSAGYVPVGCAACRHTGYRGRSGLYELALIDEPLREAIRRNDGDDALKRLLAAQPHYRTLADEGRRSAADGITSLEEAMTVTEG